MTQFNLTKWLGLTLLCFFIPSVPAKTDNLLLVPDAHITPEGKTPPFQFFLDQSTLTYKELPSKEIMANFSLKTIPSQDRQPFYAYSLSTFEYNCTKKEGRNISFKMYDNEGQLIEDMETNNEIRLLDRGGVSLENTVFHMVCDSKITPIKK